jgi:hypothetical protein
VEIKILVTPLIVPAAGWHQLIEGEDCFSSPSRVASSPATYGTSRQKCHPAGPLRLGMRKNDAPVPEAPLFQKCPGPKSAGLRLSMDSLSVLVSEIAVKSTDVVASYCDFDDFWQAQTPSSSPTPRIIVSMNRYGSRKTDRDRASRTTDTQTAPEYIQPANFIMASVPG